jgi:hypothetical protein
MFRYIGPWGCKTSRLQHFLDSSQIVVRLSPFCADCSFPPQRLLVLISVRGSVNPGVIVKLKGLGQYRNLLPSSGLEHIVQPTCLCPHEWVSSFGLAFEVNEAALI